MGRTLRELIDVPEPLRSYITKFAMPLIDLSQCSDEGLRGESLFFAYMLLLKFIQQDELPERLSGILGLFRRLLPPATGLESLETILRYLVSGTDRVSREQLRTALTETLRFESEPIMPTIAEQWIQEGIEKGREEGQLIGRIRTLQEVLGRKVDSPEALAKLSREDLQRFAADLNAVQSDRN